MVDVKKIRAEIGCVFGIQRGEQIDQRHAGYLSHVAYDLIPFHDMIEAALLPRNRIFLRFLKIKSIC